jgi:hypothetical protein
MARGAHGFVVSADGNSVVPQNSGIMLLALLASPEGKIGSQKGWLDLAEKVVEAGGINQVRGNLAKVCSVLPAGKGGYTLGYGSLPADLVRVDRKGSRNSYEFSDLGWQFIHGVADGSIDAGWF